MTFLYCALLKLSYGGSLLFSHPFHTLCLFIVLGADLNKLGQISR